MSFGHPNQSVPGRDEFWVSASRTTPATMGSGCGGGTVVRQGSEPGVEEVPRQGREVGG